MFWRRQRHGPGDDDDLFGWPPHEAPGSGRAHHEEEDAEPGPRHEFRFGNGFSFSFGHEHGGTRGGFEGGRGRGRGRFERGDLRLVILTLLAERPMHGYEVIKEIERRFGGLYAPSPGTVYPTLQMLEDMGHVTVQPAEGKKVYTITEEGRQHLRERQENVEDLRGRMGGWWGQHDPDQIRQLMHEFHNMMQALRPALHGVSPEQVKRLRQVLERTRSEIEQVFRAPGD